MNKEPLLFLCHRIPYPPNKGDKIRSFNILKKLREHYDIYLACFVDDPFDKQYVDTLKEFCVDVCALDQNKTLAKVKGLTSFLTGKPITLPYYASAQMSQWVTRTFLQQKIDKIFIYSSSMAQYCDAPEFSHAKKVIDFVDIDSDKWRQYAEKKSGLAKWVFNREYKKLATYERDIATKFDFSLFVSPDEADMFKSLQNDTLHNKIFGLLNGVDIEFFNPQAQTDPEDTPDNPYLVFTGAMDYWANVESVVWFAEKAWPKIIEKHPECQFYIVGGNPSHEVQQLAKLKGVYVTGRVHDIRPYILNANCVIAPMQIARGIQNKVLEAMALDKPIVCTSMAMEGINAAASEAIHITDDADEFAQACLSFLAKDVDSKNREWVLANFTWQQTLMPLLGYFEGEKV